jgi:hypothetical protein
LKYAAGFYRTAGSREFGRHGEDGEDGAFGTISRRRGVKHDSTPKTMSGSKINYIHDVE